MAAPRVDFYVLASDEPAARLRFACRLVEKAWLKRHRVRVQFEPGGELEAFDQMLWTFSDRSFVPHRRAGRPKTRPRRRPPPVVIADTAEADAADGDLVVNLAAALPATSALRAHRGSRSMPTPRGASKGASASGSTASAASSPQTHDMRDES